MTPRIKELDALGEDAQEIMLPFGIVKARYPVAVTTIMDSLQTSKAADAKKMGPEKFKWCIRYKRPADPSRSNEKDFVNKLVAGTMCVLIARGFRWRGAEKVSTLPPQLINQYMDRARILCNASAITESQTDNELELLTRPDTPVDPDPKPYEKLIGNIITELSELLSTPLPFDRGYIEIARLAMITARSRIK